MPEPFPMILSARFKMRRCRKFDMILERKEPLAWEINCLRKKTYNDLKRAEQEIAVIAEIEYLFCKASSSSIDSVK